MLRSLLSLGSKDDYLFPTVNPKEDGPDCRKDCADCTIHYPSKVKIETLTPLYGHIKGFHAQVLVATGKSDWTEKVEKEKGSLMEAFDRSSAKSKHGRIMISASDLKAPEPSFDDDDTGQAKNGSTVLLLPAFTFVDSVTGNDIQYLIDCFVDASPTGAASNRLASRPCPHDYVVLLCSHKRRDARCGITAPLIKRELERHLRPLGLYRDADDQRPGGVGIYFVSHVGGHKFAANVLIYRKKEQQMIWLARVRPEHCEGVVKYTILEGKVVHPKEQLRGGFDRLRGLTSW